LTELAQEDERSRRDRLADYQRRYRAENRDRLADYQRRYHAENRDRIADYQRRYRAENRDRLAEQRRQKLELCPDCQHELLNYDDCVFVCPACHHVKYRSTTPG
jgi:hypothetical protein